MKSDDAAHDPLSFEDRERLHVTLAVLAEAAQPARPFDRLTPDAAAAPLVATGAARRSRVRRRFAVCAVACLGLVSATAAVLMLRGEDRPGISSNTPTSGLDDAASLVPHPTDGSVTTATSSTTPPTADGVEDSSIPDGPWYSLGLPGIEASVPTAVAGVPFPGARSAVWASSDGSFSQIVVAHRYARDPGFTTLQGTIEHRIVPFDSGELTLLADAADDPDPEVGSLAGNEMRWRRDDGSVVEYAAYGMRPVLLDKFVEGADDAFSNGCPCDQPGLDLVAADSGTDGLDQQSFTLDDARLTLTRSATSPINTASLGDPNTITTTAPHEIDGHPGVIVDDDTAVWERDGYWFSLNGIPTNRLDDVLDALQPTGSSPSALPGAAQAWSAGWNQLPTPPLAPRLLASVAWTGTEAVVVGGSQATCPPNASCAAYTGPTFSDGAAYNPTTNTWRSIASAPLEFSSSPVAVVGGDVYILIEPTLEFGVTMGPGHLLRYQPDLDTWDEIRNLPPGSGYQLLGTDRLVLYPSNDAGSAVNDWTYTPETDQWATLPDDGLPESYNRRMIATDHGYIVFATPVATSADGQQQVRAAAYEFGSALAIEIDTETRTGDAVWNVDGHVVLDPHGNGTGGQLDTTTRTWTELPAPPTDPTWLNDPAGVFDRHHASYEPFPYSPSGPTWVLDNQISHWIEIPTLDNRSTQASTPIGRNLFVFGGQTWHGNNGSALDEAWIWTPPSS